MTGRASTITRWKALVVFAGLAACARGSTSPVAPQGSGSPAPPATTSSASLPPEGEPADAWVAVLDTASDPARLNGPRKDVLHELGAVLEGSVVISPGECLQGLPDALSDGYVLAIQRNTEEDVRSLVSLLSEEPSFTGDVTIMCSD